MIIKQISKNYKKKQQVINDFDESQLNKNLDILSKDEEYVKSKDFTNEEKKSTEKLDKDLPEFFLDKERESEENK